MRHILFLTFCLFSYFSAHTQLSEDFSDGNFNLNPTWLGDTSKFRVLPTKILQLNAAAAGKADIVTNYTTPDTAIWSFWMNLDFDPSAANKVRIYFQTDQPDLAKAQGYFIEVGEDGTKDALKLFRQTQNGTTKLLATGKLGAMASATKTRIRIRYTPSKTWLLEADYTGGTDFQYEFEQKDTTYNKPNTAWFGIACTFTATRAKLFYFDDIFVGKPSIPTPTPNPNPIVKIDPYDLLITEIMPDPTPTIGLPDVEWIELYNRSDKSLDLVALHLWKDGKNYALPTYILPPKAYITICNATKAVFLKDFGTVLGIASFPELTNTGAKIALQTNDGKFIHAFNYTPDLFTADKKRNGGWSLELINIDAPCDGTSNWRASEHPSGGTPSQQNSVFKAEKSAKKLEIIAAFPLNANTIRVNFSKNLNEISSNNRDLFQLSDNNIVQASLLLPDFQQVILKTEKPLLPKNVYELSAKLTLSDCLGQPIDGNNSTKIALSETPNPKDIVINEVLFNPISGGEDFVELFNRSNKVLNINDIRIYNSLKDKKLTTIDTNWLFFPNEYLVLTNQPFDIEQRFPSAHARAILPVNLPALNDDEGDISLIHINNNQPVLIDSFTYSERFHSPFLSNREGVALERIDPAAPTQLAANWSSAASSVGFGTPTARNSQFLAKNATENATLLTIADPTFSPDGDGNKDFLWIAYTVPKAGFVGNITIFDAAGRVVKHLAKNELLATEGFFRWEGEMDNGELAKTGIYVVFGEFFEPKGSVLRGKQACVLAR
jgi:Lamin Tail Domain